MSMTRRGTLQPTLAPPWDRDDPESLTERRQRQAHHTKTTGWFGRLLPLAPPAAQWVEFASEFARLLIARIIRPRCKWSSPP